MNRRIPLSGGLGVGLILAAALAACGPSSTRTVTQVDRASDRETDESPAASTTPPAAVERDAVETDRGAVVVDRPARQTSAVAGTMAAIVSVIALPITLILGIFDVLF